MVKCQQAVQICGEPTGDAQIFNLVLISLIGAIWLFLCYSLFGTWQKICCQVEELLQLHIFCKQKKTVICCLKIVKKKKKNAIGC